MTQDGRTVYVADEGSGTVTPLAITPNGRTVYVVSEGSSTATPDGQHLVVADGDYPVAVAITG